MSSLDTRSRVTKVSRKEARAKGDNAVVGTGGSGFGGDVDGDL